jgi:AcrR family transcriptional regulator
MTERLTREQSRAQTRAKLLDAAERLFAESGYVATSIEEISERGGFSRGAFYANFSDKADIFMTLLEARNEANMQLLRAQLSGDWAKDVGAFSEWFDRGFDQFGSLQTAYIEFQPVAAGNPAYRERLAARLRDVRQTASIIIEEAAGYIGVTLAMPSERFASMAMALIDGFAMHRRLDPAGSPPSILAEAVQCLWQAAMATDQPKGSREDTIP